jgi:UDP-N-acetylenolpyruvoylglucosamine reductase
VSIFGLFRFSSKKIIKLIFLKKLKIKIKSKPVQTSQFQFSLIQSIYEKKSIKRRIYGPVGCIFYKKIKKSWKMLEKYGLKGYRLLF